ncbi:MAG: carbohydrate ABC transporter permease [Tenericutes bacterium]|nr:carbohydrate ABC transporter permease [Mycoplasmatota bacterium]
MKRQKTSMIFLEIFAILLLLVVFFPFFLVIVNASKSVSDIITNPIGFEGATLAKFISNINAIFQSSDVKYLNSFMNSAIITTFSLLAIGVFSGMAAWVLVRTKTKYSSIIFLLFISGMVIPFQIVMLPLVRHMENLTALIGIPLRDTYWGVVLVYIGFGSPLSIFMFHGFIKSVPIDIEEAAIIDGCTKPQVFFHIILPILKPIFVTLLVLNGMWIWNDYLLPLLVISKNGEVRTLPLAVANLAGSYVKQWDLILTSVLLTAIPVVILFLFAQKHIIKGMTSGAIK